eukprot:CAMPEP_0204294486 /NCGR_PEP_ID=MMETSP0468-20130131/68081_1 /ASSEMBLY_ACC=CAM_ASM_000383 /TAXON_ID=2969 /ORGANISM="Oxyrrhis marina" /LENGTH=154 /DNA_ID=CAMNT_0051273049 /DNA_START=214 /DNA_END=678 /DNA_ORIENTATION=-
MVQMRGTLHLHHDPSLFWHGKQNLPQTSSGGPFRLRPPSLGYIQAENPLRERVRSRKLHVLLEEMLHGWGQQGQMLKSWLGLVGPRTDARSQTCGGPQMVPQPNAAVKVKPIFHPVTGPLGELPEVLICDLQLIHSCDQLRMTKILTLTPCPTP